MLDLFHIPNSQQDIKIFYANQGDRAYQTWQKPRKCSFIYIISIDAGGGGSSGVSTIANASTPNTCGGASGGINRALINSNLVPDTLYIKVGKGGTGGPSATGGGTGAFVGTAGESSGVFISSQLSSQGTASQSVSFIGGASSNNGGNLFTASPGTPVSVIGNNYLIGLTNFISIEGRDSSGMNISTQPPNISPLTSQIVMGGGAGAPYNGTATSFNGAGINSTSISPLISGGIGGTTLGGNGADGITSWQPLFSTGGAGGGNATTAGGVAGNGGNGGIGSGGGAGGNANIGTSGKGGDGGDGLVIIITF
jgi:hypothetical protein